MKGNERDWIYIEDRLPPLNERVLVVAKINYGLGPSIVRFLDYREQRTGWGRTIECWHHDVEAKRLAWLPIPEFKLEEESE